MIWIKLKLNTIYLILQRKQELMPFQLKEYNTNVIGLNSIPIYSKAINLFKDFPNKKGTLQLDVTSIKSLLLEENGVNGHHKNLCNTNKTGNLNITCYNGLQRRN